MNTLEEEQQCKNTIMFIDDHLINEYLYCPICLEVFDQPYRLKCGHTFCYNCIHKSYITSKKNICAQCKCDYSSRALERDFIATNIIKSLRVKCMNPKCQWIGRYDESKKHQRKCQYKIKVEQEVPQSQVIDITQEQDNTQIVEEIPRPCDFMIDIQQNEEDDNQWERQERQGSKIGDKN